MASSGLVGPRRALNVDLIGLLKATHHLLTQSNRVEGFVFGWYALSESSGRRLRYHGFPTQPTPPAPTPCSWLFQDVGCWEATYKGADLKNNGRVFKDEQ